MDYVVAVGAIALYVLLGKKLGKFAGKPGVWILRPLLLLVATASVAATGLGSLLAGWIGDLLGWITNDMFGWGAGTAVVATLASLILIVGLVLDLKDKKADGFAKFALITLPFAVMVASGPLASAIENVFDGVNNGARSAVSNVAGTGGDSENK